MSRLLKADGSLAEKTVSSAVGVYPGRESKTYLPGESWIHRWAGLSGSGTIQHVIDWVLFEDESTWGPDREKRGGQLQGVVQGWRAAYRHLGDVPANRGIDAVRTELAKASVR